MATNFTYNQPTGGYNPNASGYNSGSYQNAGYANTNANVNANVNTSNLNANPNAQVYNRTTVTKTTVPAAGYTSAYNQPQQVSYQNQHQNGNAYVPAKAKGSWLMPVCWGLLGLLALASLVLGILFAVGVIGNKGTYIDPNVTANGTTVNNNNADAEDGTEGSTDEDVTVQTTTTVVDNNSNNNNASPRPTPSNSTVFVPATPTTVVPANPSRPTNWNAPILVPTNGTISTNTNTNIRVVPPTISRPTTQPSAFDEEDSE